MASDTGYDRHRELKAFDDTKAGVKGLVDAGITTVPAIFHHPPGILAPSSTPANHISIPVIDLAETSSRTKLVGEVKAAAEVGLFQVVNHGLQAEAMAEILAAVRRFHEEPAEAKRPYYTRDVAKNVRYQSNFDLFNSPAANWRDTLFCEMAPNGAAPDDLPSACRSIMVEYTKLMQNLGATLLELLSEALGLHPGYLEQIWCLEGLRLACHYYPACPEPHFSLGTSKHSDPTFITALLQDAIGGLQVLIGGQWVDVPPVPGALVVNIGDFLQIISNDKFKSVEHRVISKSIGPRVSVACFFSHVSGRVYSPIRELTSDASPPLYREFSVEEFLTYYRHKGLDGRSSLGHFRLQ